MKRRSLFSIIALATLIVISGCSSTTPRTVDPTPSPMPTAMRVRSVSMYFVGDTPTGFKLFSEKYSLRGDYDLVTLALDELISGKAQPADKDYANLWGTGTSLNAYTLDGSIGVIDLKMGKLNVGAEAESRAIDQLLWTASGIDENIDGIRLLVDGEPIESLAGHVDATSVIKRQETYQVLSNLQISSFREGAVLKNPVNIWGQACTFEANVVWTLRKDGKVLKKAPTTAASACPDRSSWNVELGLLGVGSYSFTVQDFSAEDGSLSAQDNKNFTVTNF